MTNFLGMAEVPLAILAWMMVGLLGAGLLFLVVAAVLAAISEYADHKQRLRWDKIMKGVRK